MSRPEPAWVECFCSHWEQDVVYSTSGPWWSEKFLDQMLDYQAEHENKAVIKAGGIASAPRVFGGSTASEAGAISSAGGPPSPSASAMSSSSPIAVEHRGRGFLADILSRPMPLSPIAAKALEKAGGRGGKGHPFSELSDSDFTQSWRWFMANTGEARAAMVHLLLEQVPRGEIPRLLPANVTGADTGERWFRLRQAVDWESCPGLEWWLHSYHDRLGSELGIDFKDILALIASGGDTGLLGLARPPARLPNGAKHPLAAESHGLCTFYRRPVRKGTPLGFYPGLLCDMREVEIMMATLPGTSEQALALAREQDAAAVSGSTEGMLVDGTVTAASHAHAAHLNGGADIGSTEPASFQEAVATPGASNGADTGAEPAAAPNGSDAQGVDAPSSGSQPPAAAAAAAPSSSSSSATASGIPQIDNDPRALMCRSLVWSYDFGSPPVPGLGRSFTFQGTFVRNVLSGINDYHRISDAPNVAKVPIILGGLFPVVLFATSRAVEEAEESLLEYGKDWYDTFCRYFPKATDIFTAASNSFDQISMADIMLSYGLSMAQKTRSARKGIDKEQALRDLLARFGGEGAGGSGASGAGSAPSSAAGKGGRRKAGGKGSTASSPALDDAGFPASATGGSAPAVPSGRAVALAIDAALTSATAAAGGMGATDDAAGTSAAGDVDMHTAARSSLGHGVVYIEPIDEDEQETEAPPAPPVAAGQPVAASGDGALAAGNGHGISNSSSSSNRIAATKAVAAPAATTREAVALSRVEGPWGAGVVAPSCPRLGNPFHGSVSMWRLVRAASELEKLGPEGGARGKGAKASLGPAGVAGTLSAPSGAASGGVGGSAVKKGKAPGDDAASSIAPSDSEAASGGGAAALSSKKRPRTESAPAAPSAPAPLAAPPAPRPKPSWVYVSSDEDEEKKRREEEDALLAVRMSTEGVRVTRRGIAGATVAGASPPPSAAGAQSSSFSSTSASAAKKRKRPASAVKAPQAREAAVATASDPSSAGTGGTSSASASGASDANGLGGGSGLNRSPSGGSSSRPSSPSLRTTRTSLSIVIPSPAQVAPAATATAHSSSAIAIVTDVAWASDAPDAEPAAAGAAESGLRTSADSAVPPSDAAATAAPSAAAAASERAPAGAPATSSSGSVSASSTPRGAMSAAATGASAGASTSSKPRKGAGYVIVSEEEADARRLQETLALGHFAPAHLIQDVPLSVLLQQLEAGGRGRRSTAASRGGAGSGSTSTSSAPTPTAAAAASAPKVTEGAGH